MHNKEVEKALACLALELPEEVYYQAIPLIKDEINKLEASNKELVKALERCVRIFYSDAPKGSKPIPFTYELEQVLTNIKD